LKSHMVHVVTTWF